MRTQKASKICHLKRDEIVDFIGSPEIYQLKDADLFEKRTPAVLFCLSIRGESPPLLLVLLFYVFGSFRKREKHSYFAFYHVIYLNIE
jgi:hypothetical protein